MADIEIAARFAQAALFALLAIVLLRDHRNTASGLMGGLFALAGCADLVNAPFGPRTGVIGAALQAASISGVLWFWLLAKSLFDDAFRWRWSFLVILTVLWVCSLGAYFYTDAFTLVESGSAFEFDRYKASLIPQQTIILLLAALVIYEAIRDWRTDLVEIRRRFRRWFLFAIAALLLTVSFSNYLQLGTQRDPVIDATTHLLGLVIVMAVVAVLVRMRGELFPTGMAAPFQSVEPSAVDDPMITRINELMSDQLLFTQHGLTIAMLAERLGEKEYRVRKVINGGMGHRNFSQFLNHYRVAEAARRLVAAETRRLPVLTIAIDVGFASLAPFNKAFKAINGVTPTEYRKHHGNS